MRLVFPIVAIVAAGFALPARAADVKAGKTIFEHTCINCHSLEVGVNKVGPSLWHVVGRPSGTIQGFTYSPALMALHQDWTKANLDAYLANPRADVHGARMYFKGLATPAERANVIAYLESTADD